MKKILILGLATLVVAGFVWVAKNWADVQADYWLLRTDLAISRTKSWRMRLQPTDAKLPKDWMVIEAIPPDREHGWQHVDRSLEVGDTKTKRIAGDLEYIRIGDDRYFRGDYHVVKMRPEELKTYAGNTCREWSYTWKVEETAQVMHDTLCVGTSDHLPYHLTTSDGWADATYEWNPKVSIDAPNPVFDRPKDFHY
jgi:hypothetical protein